MRYHERMVMLSVIDGLWKDHLLSMDHLKEGISLRGYAQKDPLVEYKRESFDMFEAMMLKFQEDTVRFLFRMQILGPDGQPVDASRAAARDGAAALRRWRARRGPRRATARRARLRFPRAQPSTTIDASREGVPRARRSGSLPRPAGRAAENQASPRSAVLAKR